MRDLMEAIGVFLLLLVATALTLALALGALYLGVFVVAHAWKAVQ